jgi:hypothetical protein
VLFRSRYDGTTLKLFLNGNEIKSTSASGVGTAVTQAMYLGRYAAGSTEYLKGDLDEVRVSNTARSDAWINTSYTNQNNPTAFITVGGEETQSGGEGPWWDTNWSYRKKITIDHTKVAADLINFPVLITHTSADFAAHAQPDGDDFVFRDATNTTRYNHEIEYYNSATGELVAWVNLPFLSSTKDTVLCVYYGNPDCGNQENITGTWNPNYLMVHHMTGASYTELDDSTAGNRDITSAGGNPLYNQGGQVGKCVAFDGDGDYLKATCSLLPADSTYTAGAWVYADGYGDGQRLYIFEGDTDYPPGTGISLLIWLANTTFNNIARTTTGWPMCYSRTTVDVLHPQWFYVCTRADATADRLDLFVNGISEAHTAITGGPILAELQGLNIGTRTKNDQYWMDGKIDELRISTVARKDSWIKTEYNNMAAPSIFVIVGSEQSPSDGDSYRYPMKMQENDQWQWSNFTWQNQSIPVGTIVGWQIYYIDTSGNANATDIMSFTIRENTPPYQPSDPNPADGATDVSITTDLNWTGGDPDPGDTVTYDVYFGTSSTPPQVSDNQTGTSYDLGTLNYSTPYYWKIVSWDNHGASTAGPIWSFTTEVNYPPYTPSNPTPANGTTDVPITINLSWTGGDPDPEDTVTYDVYFGTVNPPTTKVSENQSATTYDPGTMLYSTSYYWMIVAWDNHNASSAGPVWMFTTEESPNQPPATPIKPSGRQFGSTYTTYNYTTKTTDPDGDNVYYKWDWGDGTSDWLGPYPSGENVSASHLWTRPGSYNITVKAKDIHGAESLWSEPLVIRIRRFSALPALADSATSD